jgi:hypothetical protein
VCGFELSVLGSFLRRSGTHRTISSFRRLAQIGPFSFLHKMCSGRGLHAMVIGTRSNPSMAPLLFHLSDFPLLHDSWYTRNNYNFASSGIWLSCIECGHRISNINCISRCKPYLFFNGVRIPRKASKTLLSKTLARAPS